MKKPIHRASLRDLLFIIRSDSSSGWIDKDGKIFYFLSNDSIPVTAIQAEAEIERRFKALQRKIRRLEAGR